MSTSKTWAKDIQWQAVFRIHHDEVFKDVVKAAVEFPFRSNANGKVDEYNGSSTIAYLEFSGENVFSAEFHINVLTEKVNKMIQEAGEYFFNPPKARAASLDSLVCMKKYEGLFKNVVKIPMLMVDALFIEEGFDGAVVKARFEIAVEESLEQTLTRAQAFFEELGKYAND